MKPEKCWDCGGELVPLGSFTTQIQFICAGCAAEVNLEEQPIENNDRQEPVPCQP